MNMTSKQTLSRTEIFAPRPQSHRAKPKTNESSKPSNTQDPKPDPRLSGVGVDDLLLRTVRRWTTAQGSQNLVSHVQNTPTKVYLALACFRDLFQFFEGMETPKTARQLIPVLPTPCDAQT